jgi:radical SAM superfamily enzyme YgiQ (UPF0313 family)
MNISFIRPNLFNQRSSDAMQPLSFAVLKSFTPGKHRVSLYDERLAELPRDDRPDLVAISVETYTARRSYEIADEYRSRGVPVVMGGYHPTMLPDEAGEHADAIVIGDAELVWSDLLADFEQTGKLDRLYHRQAHQTFSYPVVDRSLFEGRKYASIIPVQFSRGCRYNCDFCSINSFYDGRISLRSFEEVFAEIEALQSKYLFFTDDNLLSDSKRARALFKKLVPLKKKWVCQVSLDVARDHSMLDLMSRAGCLVVIVGFESLERNNLVQMNKKANLDGGNYRELVSRIRDAGIMIYGTFVLGYDHDTTDTFDRVLDFAVSNRLLLANFNPLTPMPGTPLWDRLRRENRLLHDKWWLSSSYSYGDAVFKPAGMTPRQLAEGCARIRFDFSRYSSIAGRALDFKANCSGPENLAIYILSNLVSRREIHRKQGAALGSCSANAGEDRVCM